MERYPDGMGDFRALGLILTEFKHRQDKNPVRFRFPFEDAEVPGCVMVLIPATLIEMS
jgi:hypothetical protein